MRRFSSQQILTHASVQWPIELHELSLVTRKKYAKDSGNKSILPG
jgi:hypothetical protein